MVQGKVDLVAAEELVGVVAALMVQGKVTDDAADSEVVQEKIDLMAEVELIKDQV